MGASGRSLRVAVLGLGRLGSAHARTLAGLAEVGELHLYDVADDLARRLAGELRAVRAPTLEAALAAADAAVIVTPTATHAELIGRCLDLGLPTFCEKPVALGMEESRAVVEHVRRVGGVLQIGFQRRFDLGFRAARELIRDGSVGRVYGFTMVSRDAHPPPEAYIATSGGIFRDLHIHDFDAVRWLFDDEVEEVAALGSVAGFESYRAHGDVATTAIAVRLGGGAVGVLTGARDNPAGYDIRVEIYGSRDSLAVGFDARTPLRSVERDAPVLAGPAYPGFVTRFAEAYRAELAHFLRLARGEAENPCTAEDALEALRIAEAAERSLREGGVARVATAGAAT